MPKKTAAAKKKSTAKTTAPAKRRGRPPGSKNKSTTKVSKPLGKRGGAVRPINNDTGFVEETDQDVIACALLAGGESRTDIAERLEKVMDTTTRNGTPKQITNMVSGVLQKMLAAGFTVESSFKVNPPTPASKRAATRAANAAASKPATTKSGKRRGRPPGSKNKTAAAPAKKTTGARRGRPPGSKNKKAASKKKKK